MGKEIKTFGDVEIEKNKFYRYKSPIFYLAEGIEFAVLFRGISFLIPLPFFSDS